MRLTAGIADGFALGVASPERRVECTTIGALGPLWLRRLLWLLL